MDIELVLDAQTELGEGPIWDAARGTLLFVDIMRGHVHEFAPSSGAHRTIDVGEPVGTVVPSERGDWIVATHTGFHRLDPVSGRKTSLAFVEADAPDNRMNDGAVDRRGRFWAGTMSMTGRRHGSLYRLDADGRVARALAGLTISNGIGWSPDGRRMYFVDTVTGRIDVFAFDDSTGTLANPEVFVNVSPDAGHPDGLVVDEDGFVWLALWAGGALHRYAPDGRLDLIVPLPVTHPTKCAFGGADRSDLYITSAWIELSASARVAQPLAGGLFRCRPGVRGLETHAFAG